jgi:hypothetical protein
MLKRGINWKSKTDERMPEAGEGCQVRGRTDSRENENVSKSIRLRRCGL